MSGWRDQLLVVLCDLRGHEWAGARQYAAQSDGLLMCVRCGYEATEPHPRTRRPLVRLT